MIKFFRKIRFNLMSENKTGKYLKYAIGEIVLVVIGILIALSINNWNNKKIQHSTDIEFLGSLKSELVIDSTNLSEKINSYTQRNEGINGTLVSLDTIIHINPKQYQEIIKTLKRMEVLTPIGKNLQKNDVALANGTLTRIDQALNNRYLSYLELTKSNNEIISKLGKTLQQLTVLYLMPAIDMQNDTLSIDIQTEFIKIRNNRLLRNALVHSSDKRNTHLSYMKGQFDNANALIFSIDSLLNNQQ